MPTYLIRSNSAWQWPVIPGPGGNEIDQPHNTALTGQFENGDNAWLIVSGSNPVDDYSIDGLVIGCWNQDGTNVEDFDEDGNSLGIRHPVTDDYYELRPLGNQPTGQATKQLRYTYAAGWLQRFLRADWFYPEDNDGMVVEMRHKEFTGTWAGWGWRAEIRYVAQQRPPDARAIGIYRDEDASDYHYTTGAFVEQPSDWQVDIDGNPLTVWATETPPGFATPEKEPVHHALLLGAAQEGHATLWPEVNATVFNYWENDLQIADRVKFIAIWERRGNIAQANNWNRVLLRKNDEQHRLTWGQIINLRLPDDVTPPFAKEVAEVGVKSGLIAGGAR